MPPVTTATAALTQAQQEFTRLLRELFQLDQSDLDFGIYRIIRARAKDVEAFINDELPQTLQAARQELATRGLDEVRAERDEARQQLQQNFGLDVTSPEAVAAQETLLGAVPIFRDTLARYRAAQTQLDQAALAEDLERTIYNDLYRFFARYYDSGDFVTQPRAGEAAYMLPYNGEEVKLYWANHDQYYIKTGENFRHYRFDVGQPGDTDNRQDSEANPARLTVEFELTDADTATGNNLSKKGRVFLPASADDYFQFEAEGRRLTLRFRFAVPTEEEAVRWGTKQSVAKDDKGVNERVIRDVAERIQATGDAYLIDFWQRNTHRRGELPVNAFVYHLHRYTLPNHFDYFIHRNLGHFLGQELDYYLKHELLDLQFLGAEWSRPAQLQAMQQQLLRASVVRTVALRLIAFLHELEEYQRHLFEKKKLVVGAEYCISLDLLPPAVRPAVLAHLLTDTEPAQQQRRAWQTLGMVPATEAGAAALRDWLTHAQTTFDATATYARLPLDTQYLTQAHTDAATALRDELLGAFPDLDGQTTGVLINSENWQALSLLSARYEGQIKCVYIDPPYNTETDKKERTFPYKDGYEASTYITMLYERLQAGKQLMHKSGVMWLSCDDHEEARLKLIMTDIFGQENYLQRNLIWHIPGGTNKGYIARAHEYIIPFAKQIKATRPFNRLEGMSDESTKHLTNAPGEKNKLSQITFKKGMRYEGIEDKTFSGTVGGAKEPIYVVGEMHFKDGKLAEDVVLESSWRNKDQVETYLRGEEALDERGQVISEIYFTESGKPMYVKALDFYSPKSVQEFSTRNSVDQLGLKFPYPKPTGMIEFLGQLHDDSTTVLDFFAGSGTTAHAVINLNRQLTDSQRRFILVEMGEYFDTVTKPRVLKAAYSSTWQNGLAPTPTAGLSQLVQVLRLEQYEDTLNNMEFAAARDTEATFFAHSPEDRLRYVLARSASGSKPTLGPALLTHPFGYELEIVLANERKPVAVDLVASFHLLLGLHVERLWAERGPDNRLYRLVRGHRRGLRHLCIWRDAPGHGQSAEAEEAALVAEREWVQAQPWYQEAQAAHAVVYCNAQQLLGAESTEAELHRLLFNG